MTPNNQNLSALQQELNWLAQVLDAAFSAYFQQDQQNWLDIPLPNPPEDTAYGQFIRQYRLGSYERLMLALCLAPQLKPQALDLFFMKNATFDRPYTEFGGNWSNQGGFLPTVQTLVFIITANDPLRFQQAYQLLAPTHVLQQQDVIHFSKTENHQSKLHAQMSLQPNWFVHLLTGEPLADPIHHQFGHILSNPLSWDELVLDPQTQNGLLQITTWCQQQHTLLHDWHLQQKLQPGYRALFYGPTGTGKTLSAALLGKVLNKKVYQIDTAFLSSKYIGETEKNLNQLFKTATQRDWILYFDDAATLFNTTPPINECHTNSISLYLSQQIRNFAGLAILATDRKTNIDPRFYPLFQNSIYFPAPNAQQRLILWQQAFSGKPQLAAEIKLKTIAENHELTAAAILNVLRYCAITALSKNADTVSLHDLMEAISREKQG